MSLIVKLFKFIASLRHVNLIHALKNFIRNTKSAAVFLKYIIKEFFAFYILILLYILDSILIKRLIKVKVMPHFMVASILKNFSNLYSFLERKLDSRETGSISKLDLIQLSIRNMKVKKTRTFVTIGGVAIGIAAIVFLVSLGYGLQELVVSRVARLEELKQADVSTQPGSKVKIDDKTVADVKALPEVEDIYPLIAVVGRVNYQSSVSDMAVYGVTSGYLDKSAIKPVKGKIFSSNELAMNIEDFQQPEITGEVQGVSTSNISGDFNEFIDFVEFSIQPDEWIRVRSKPSLDSEIIGYTKRMEGTQTGETYLGDSYIGSDYGEYASNEEDYDFGLWIKSKIYLWEESECDSNTNIDCIEDKYQIVRGEDGIQVQTEGYFAHINVISNAAPKIVPAGQVLGESDQNVDVTSINVLASETVNAEEATAQGEDKSKNELQIIEDGEWVEIAGESSKPVEEISKVAISSSAIKEAVVNRAMLKILGIPEEEAVGKKFNTAFVIPSDLLDTSEKRVESEEAEYTIIGVTPDDASPVFYVPFIDLRSLGIVNFSQFKISVKNPDALDKVRKQIEAIGYVTQSVVDTVAQINSLFNSIRFVLGVMGMIALSVASLGMFNTLTVSLLERTREVGLMKAMGMKTSEVQELFLTESIIMGFCAGLAGLVLGWIGGKLVGVVLTMFSLVKGQGFIDVSHVPAQFIFIILTLSFLVGMLTGLYPAKRSKKISALDALRYE